MGLLRNIIDVIYPPFCQICHSCLKKININSPPFCRKCSRSLSYERKLCEECIGKKSYLKRVWSWGIYEDTLKECLHLFKYEKKFYLINLFKKPLLEFFDRNSISRSIDIIIPVPLHITKLEERGFNQAKTIARIFSKHYGIKLTEALKKIKITLPQNRLNKNQREKNVKGAFSARYAECIHQKRILLIDDVFTTGSTLNECAKTLFKSGAKEVYGFTLARGL